MKISISLDEDDIESLGGREFITKLEDKICSIDGVDYYCINDYESYEIEIPCDIIELIRTKLKKLSIRNKLKLFMIINHLKP